MRRVNRFGIMAVLAVATVVAPAFAGSVTVGRFYTELAQAKHLVAVDAASAEASLRGAGFNLPKLALDKSLTEGDMTAISNSLGLTVTTDRPSKGVSESDLNTFMSSYGSQVGASRGTIGTPVDENPFVTHGSKKKKPKKPKKKKKSTHEPI